LKSHARGAGVCVCVCVYCIPGNRKEQVVDSRIRPPHGRRGRQGGGTTSRGRLPAADRYTACWGACVCRGLDNDTPHTHTHHDNKSRSATSGLIGYTAYARGRVVYVMLQRITPTCVCACVFGVHACTHTHTHTHSQQTS